MSSLIDRAQVLAEAMPYIQKYSGTTIVVKYGGNAMISEELRQAVISDLILLSLVGVRVVVVHGGGPEISAIAENESATSPLCGRAPLHRRHHHGRGPGHPLRQGQ